MLCSFHDEWSRLTITWAYIFLVGRGVFRRRHQITKTQVNQKTSQVLVSSSTSMSSTKAPYSGCPWWRLCPNSSISTPTRTILSPVLSSFLLYAPRLIWGLKYDKKYHPEVYLVCIVFQQITRESFYCKREGHDYPTDYWNSYASL